MSTNDVLEGELATHYGGTVASLGHETAAGPAPGVRRCYARVMIAQVCKTGPLPRLSNVPASFCLLLGQIKGHAELIRT